jgi:WD40-like Beta Propeller Repeat
MAEEASRVSLARLLAENVQLEIADTVAIVRALCADPGANDSRPATPLTPGKVWIERDGSLSLSEDATFSVDELGSLFEILLVSTRRTESGRLPVPLVLTMARASRQVDAPQFANMGELSQSLARFDTQDHPTLLRDLFLRWHRASHTGIQPVRAPDERPAAYVPDERAAPATTFVRPPLFAPATTFVRPPLFATTTTFVRPPLFASASAAPARRRLSAKWILAAAAIGMPVGILFAVAHPPATRDRDPAPVATTGSSTAAPEAPAIAGRPETPAAPRPEPAREDPARELAESARPPEGVPLKATDAGPSDGILPRVADLPSDTAWGGSWFPDRRRIAHAREGRLVILDTVTGRATEYAPPVAGGSVRTPVVSPDGRRLIVVVRGDGGWLLELSDGSFQRVLDDPSAERITWLPGGRQLTYYSRRSGTWGVVEAK